MHILLVYDISDDRKRYRIADACLDFGLDRIQMSAFSGELSRNHQKELMDRLERLLADSVGSIQLYPIDETSWEKRLAVEHV